MKNFEELSMEAYKDIELSEFADVPEKYAYFRLRNLYYRYKCGDYSKENAIKIKKQIEKEYNEDENKYRDFLNMFQEYNQNRINNEYLLHQLEKEEDYKKKLDIAIQIIASCVHDETLITRHKQKGSEIDF